MRVIIELMIVAAILSILAAIVIPRAGLSHADGRRLVCRDGNGELTLNVPAANVTFEADVAIVGDGVRRKMLAGETCTYVTILEQ